MGNGLAYFEKPPKWLTTMPFYRYFMVRRFKKEYNQTEVCLTVAGRYSTVPNKRIYTAIFFGKKVALYELIRDLYVN